ncbi:hypothetical protein PLICRDRAFT_172193 [Plicaturopsis crispa FD-325 SS-3]|nr:hypothetical protein PLICRDRAFT_172193 [Plicaturopsis crispa FD-325 SS-3]
MSSLISFLRHKYHDPPHVLLATHLQTPKSPYNVAILSGVNASGVQVQTFEKTLRISPATTDAQRNIQDCLNGLTKLASPRAPIEVKFDDKDFIVTSPYFAQGNIVNYLDAFLDVKAAQDSILALMKQVLVGMIRLQELGATHGNLCANNILVDADGTAIVVDAGMYLLLKGIVAPSEIHSQYRTQAPEILFPGDDEVPSATPAADMYSFASTMQEVYNFKTSTGLPDGQYRFLVKMRSGGITEAERIVGMPADVANALRGCWDVDPSKRPTTLQVLERLESL